MPSSSLSACIDSRTGEILVNLAVLETALAAEMRMLKTIELNARRVEEGRGPIINFEMNKR